LIDLIDRKLNRYTLKNDLLAEQPLLIEVNTKKLSIHNFSNI